MKNNNISFPAGAAPDPTNYTKLIALCGCLLGVPVAQAVTNVFFNALQTATLVVSNITSKTTIITNVTSRCLSLDRDANGVVTMLSTGVPWYSYECQRATNAAFTGTLQTWPVQAWAGGSIYTWDDFADLGAHPRQAFYRLRYTP